MNSIMNGSIYELLSSNEKSNDMYILEREIFIKDIYKYYIKGGFYNIILSNTLDILSLIFGSLFAMFVFIFLDWGTIIKCGKITKIDVEECGDIITYININSLITPNFFQVFVLFFIFVTGLFTIYKILIFYSEVKKYSSICDYYKNKLNITSKNLEEKSWDDIINLSSKNENIQIDKITSIILRDENYFIALINNNIYNISNISFTRQLEFNLYYGVNCLEFLIKTEEQIKNRLIKLGIINLILSPFILIYIIVSFIFKNIDEIYLNKKILGPRRYTQLSKWKFREYNELEHYFTIRLNKSIKYSNEYSKQFPSLFTENIFKFTGMISGAFIVLFLLFSILDENILLYVTFLNRSLIFYAGIFATISAISRSFIVEPENSIYDPNFVMEKVTKYTHYMPEHWKNNSNKNKVRNEFLSMFNYIIILFLYEIVSVFTTPYILLFVLPKDVKKIHLFLKKNTTYIKEIGTICKLSDFNTNENEIENVNNKLESSISYFSDNHPLWMSVEKI